MGSSVEERACSTSSSSSAASQPSPTVHSGTLVHGSISEMMAMMPSLMEMMKGEYSALEMMLARTAYINATSMPCSVGGKTTEDCCSNCDYCSKCEACKVCDTMCTDICKYCPQCPTDCVKSGYCGQQCNVTGLPDNRPCLGCGCNIGTTTT